jgi:hypothetical protein
MYLRRSYKGSPLLKQFEHLCSTNNTERGLMHTPAPAKKVKEKN